MNRGLCANCGHDASEHVSGRYGRFECRYEDAYWQECNCENFIEKGVSHPVSETHLDPQVAQRLRRMQGAADPNCCASCGHEPQFHNDYRELYGDFYCTHQTEDQKRRFARCACQGFELLVQR